MLTGGNVLLDVVCGLCSLASTLESLGAGGVAIGESKLGAGLNRLTDVGTVFNVFEK